MDREATNAPADLSTDLLPSGNELHGSVLDAVRTLLADNDGDAVLEIVRKLVADNSDMARRLARIAARFKKSEKVGKAQLVLFLDALERGEGEPETETDEPPDEIDDADDKGADSGGERAAIAYTILGSCRLAGVDPIAYLTDVLPKLTRLIRLLDLPALLPSRWAAARAAASAT